MVELAVGRITSGVTRRAVLAGVALALLIPSCAARSANSGVAVAQVGRGLSMHTQAVPQGAQACAMEEAITARPGTAEKPVSETCGKALNSDLLWRRAMLVLSAYSEKLDAIASGENPETAGQLEAALTGVRDDNWIEAESGQEQAARDAVTKLVNQMTAKDEKADLDKTVKDAAPHVRTLCTGLSAYLDEQAGKFGEVRQEIEKKRAAKSDRRCATFDNRTICVSESVIDRIVYANAYGGLAMQEMNHLDARDDVASFCAAHAKLEAAAGSGTTNKDETYAAIVDAVKAVPRAQPPKQTPAPAEPSEKPKDLPEKK